MWSHNCPEDGMMEVGDGEECNWCGATETKVESDIDLSNMSQEDAIIPNSKVLDV